MQNAKMAVGHPFALADDIRFDHPDPADVVMIAIRCSCISRYAKLFGGSTTPYVFTMHVELKRRYGQ